MPRMTKPTKKANPAVHTLPRGVHLAPLPELVPVFGTASTHPGGWPPRAPRSSIARCLAPIQGSKTLRASARCKLEQYR